MKTPNVIARFWSDIRRKEFIPLKILYFMVYGGLFSLIPFLSIQARSLGIREQEFGAIAGILPLLGIICSAVAGMIADKIGNFKLFLSFAMAASGLTALIFLAVPVARITYKLPDLLPLDLNCTSLGEAEVEVSPPYQCDYKISGSGPVYAKIIECHYDCSGQRAILTIPSELDQRLCSIIPECSGTNDHLAFMERWSNSHNSTLFNESLVQESYIPIRLKVSQINNEAKISTSKSCPDFSKIGLRTTYTAGSNNGTKENLCWLHCQVQTDRREFCSNDVSVEENNPTLTIALYVLCMLLQQITLISSLPLFEGATIAILKEKDGDIGLQRLYSNVGKLVMTPVSGVLIDAFSKGGKTNFKPAIYMYCIINFMSAICITFIDLKFKKPAKNITREFKQLLVSFDVLTFLFIGLIVGVTTGVIDTFLFWILEDMGASTSLMGITITVGSVFGVFILLFAYSIIDKIGQVNTLCLGLVFFVIRLLGYSLITDPWWALPFEAMECFTTALYGVAQASYIAYLSTSSTIVSLQGLSVGISHGLGRGIGNMMGGFMAKNLGLRVTYRIMAVICGCSAAGYAVLNVLVFRKQAYKREVAAAQPSDSGNAEVSQETNGVGNVKVDKTEVYESGTAL